MYPALSFAPIFSDSPMGGLFGVVFVLLIVIAGVWDVRVRRIPNALVLVLATTGVFFSSLTFGLGAGSRLALAGIAAGLAIWLAFYALGVLGAGDVKFFAAAAAWLGPSLTWRAALVSAVVGGALAVLFLVRDSRLGTTVHRIALMPFARSLSIDTIDALPAAQRRRQLPYGVALGAGVLVMACFPGLLG